MEAMATVAVHHIEEVFASQAVVLLPGVDGHLESPPSAQLPSDRWQADLSIADWVFHHNQPAGLGTNTLAGTKALYLPLRGSAVVFGVIAVLPANARRILLPEQRSLLETFAGQLALAVERARVTEQSEVAKVTAQTESLRNTLLAAISHDLRTPLAVISGASAALNDPSITIDDQARRDLVSSIATKSREMSDLITQVLELTRLESGEIRLSLDWQTIDDLMGIALGRLESALKGYPVTVNLPPDLPALRLDGTLIAQVLINILENVTRHTPHGTQVVISAAVIGAALEIRIDDNGPGLPSGDSERLFDKFHRGREEGTNGGAGLGLAICRAIIGAHGGRIRAENALTGGSSFIISLPVSDGGVS
jgi:two-component system sensor histidine kinase KdpD